MLLAYCIPGACGARGVHGALHQRSARRALFPAALPALEALTKRPLLTLSWLRNCTADDTWSSRSGASATTGGAGCSDETCAILYALALRRSACCSSSSTELEVYLLLHHSVAYIERSTLSHANSHRLPLFVRSAVGKNARALGASADAAGVCAVAVALALRRGNTIHPPERERHRRGEESVYTLLERTGEMNG